MTVVKLYGSHVVKLIRKNTRVLFSRRYLLWTNTAISVAMSCAGDGLQQKFQIRKKEMPHWNFRRSRDVGLTGLVIGPFCHFWYLYLDRWLPGHSAKIVTQKLIVDQFVCSPVVIFSFLFGTSLLEGLNWNEIKTEITEKGKTLYKAEWLIWPPAQTINFAFLPTKYRVLFDNCVSFGFDWYFSHVKYGKCKNKTEEDLEEKEAKADDPCAHIIHSGSHLPFVHLQAAEMVERREHLKIVHLVSKGCENSFSDGDEPSIDSSPVPRDV